jgi:hypothetical protein
MPYKYNADTRKGTKNVLYVYINMRERIKAGKNPASKEYCTNIK